MTIIRVLQNKMEIIHLRPLSQAEIAGHTSHTIFETFIDGITTATFPPARLRHVGSELSHVINAGGYPPALLRTSSKRRAVWYRDYISTIIQRDVRDISAIQNLAVLPRLLKVAAGQSARLFNASELAAPFALSRPTISSYLILLEQLFIIEQLEPW